MSLSLTGSSELIRSLLSGPRISLNAATSKTSAACTNASAASFGLLNSFCFGCEVLAAAVLGSAARKESVRQLETRIAATSKQVFEEFIIVILNPDFIANIV